MKIVSGVTKKKSSKQVSRALTAAKGIIMIYIIDCGTSWLEEIKKNVTELRYQYKVIKLNEIENAGFESCSGIIISGAPTLLTQVDQNKYERFFTFIKTVNVPVLGICLGHQIMGLLYGSKINMGKTINKEEKIKIAKHDDLFAGIENNSLFREVHSEFITLPKSFMLLAKSESCYNEAMKHMRKRLYGVQFHPEVSSIVGRKLFMNFLNMCVKD